MGPAVLFSLLIGLLFPVSVAGQSEKGLYTIVAVKAFRPSSIYNVIATCYNVTSDVTLTVSLVANNKTFVGKEVVLKSGEMQTVPLEIPDEVPETSYTLVAEGRGGMTFRNSTDVTVKRKTLSLFIQTDKAMYNPGQIVLIRVVAVDENLKPHQGRMDVEVYDLSGNKIQQWLNQSSDVGVVKQSLQLSDQTPLGNWKIVATAAANTQTKDFQVAEYVLPKFEVSVTLPPYFLVNRNRQDLQKDLLVTIFAKYTYGQPVKGRANVTIQINPYSQWDTSNYTKKIMDIELVNGKADISLTIKDLLALVPIAYYSIYYTPDPWSELSYRTILVVASVNETVTGISLQGNSTVACKVQKYDLKFMSISPNSYKPGLLYTAYLQLSQADGSLPEASDIMLPSGEYRTVNVQATMSYPSRTDRYGSYISVPPKYEYFNITVDPSGYMSFSLFVDDNITSVYFSASFYVEITNSSASAYKSVEIFKSRDNQGIQISFNSQDGVIRALQQVTFTVKTTEPIATFQYEVLSKGNIQLSGNVVGNISYEHTFSLPTSKDLLARLAPSARVMAWFITTLGEIIADSTEVAVADVFANEVKLSFDRNMTTPSQNVSLKVEAFSGSHVFILAVDVSVLLLKSGNDITQKMVSDDLRNYDSVNNRFYYPFAADFARKKRSIWFPNFIDGADSSSIISNAGLLLMTNAFLFRYNRYIYFASGPAGPQGAAGATGPRGPEVNHPDSGEPLNQQDSIQPRMFFPETLLWVDKVTGPNGSVTVETTMPDTLTSWSCSGFAVSQVAGLGVAADSAKITVFKQFFLSPKLPYSIIRGEQFALVVTVFNYMSTYQSVLVSLQKSNYYKVQGNSSVLAQVESNDAVSVYFWIVAESLGQIPIHITGRSPVAGDAVIVMLRVKPEGVQQQYSTSVFIQLPPAGSNYSTTMDISLPPPGKLVPDSVYADVTSIGDLMGPSIKGLDNLLQMPYGCGEQNMLNFAPDVYIVDYLTISNQLTSELKTKALGFMNAGYQRELTYQRSDGSFSAFGNSDLSGSTWLTCFVIKCFHQAMDYIPVDDSKIAKSIKWIIANQSSDGVFSEPPNGRVIHVDMQGGSSEGLPLTAYAVIALLENQNNSKVDSLQLNASIDLACRYLEDQVAKVASDPYALSIISYALAQANSPKVYEVLRMSESLAKIEADTRHWEKATAPDDSPMEGARWRPPYSQARSVNIEMTAYFLLTYCRLKNVSMSLPIVKWLVAQRNANGGFSSTQDTVMALEALAAFANMIAGPASERNLLISLATDLVRYNFLPITSETSILLQSFQLPSNSTSVNITATGKGSALVQLNVKYNVYQTEDNSGINLTVRTTQNGNKILMQPCSSWPKKEGSGMVVMEINSLTGFEVSNVDDLKNQANDTNIKRVENSAEKLVVYFDYLKVEETCLHLVYDKVLPVSNVKDAAVKVFPYYDPSGARTQFYGAPQALAQNTVCTECPQCCSSEEMNAGKDTVTKPMKTATSFSPIHKPCMFLVLVMVVVQLCRFGKLF